MSLSSKRKGRGGSATNLTSKQRDMVSNIQGMMGTTDVEARKFCEKYRFELDTITKAIQNRFTDERSSQKDDDWKTQVNKSAKRKQKKKEKGEERAGRSAGRGRGRSRGPRGRMGGAPGRGRSAPRGRGAPNGRGRGISRGRRNPVQRTQQIKGVQKNAGQQVPMSQKSEKQWQTGTVQQKAVAAPANPAYNPNWGRKPLAKAAVTAASMPDPESWTEPAQSDAKNNSNWSRGKGKQASGGDWASTEKGVPNDGPAKQWTLGSSTNVPQLSWPEGKSEDKSWGSWDGPQPVSSEIQPAAAEGSNIEAENAWGDKAARGLPQRQRGQTRPRKKVQEPIGGLRPTGRGFTGSKVWRKKERGTTEPKEEPKPTTDSNILDTQSGMAKLSVAGQSNEPDVILPAYVNNVESSSRVHFGLKEDAAGAQQNARQFLSQGNSDIFGVKPVDSQMPTFGAAPSNQRHQNLQTGPTQTTSLAPAQTMSKPSQSIKQTAPSTSTASTQEPSAAPRGKASTDHKQASQSKGGSEQIASTGPAAPQGIQMQGGKPAQVGRDHGVMYTPHGYAPHTMHPSQYGMPTGDQRTFSTMYDQNAPAPQMHHAAAYYPAEYQQQLQQQAQQQQFQGVNDPRAQNARPHGRMHNKQGKGPKNLEGVKDNKPDSSNKGRGKQQRNFNGRGPYVQKGYKQNYGMKQNFSKGNFNPKQRQNMPQQPYNQQPYPMNPAVQYQPSAMHAYFHHAYLPNYYHQNAQFSPPGFRGAPYYQPAPNGYNFAGAAPPGSYPNPQTQGNYGGEEFSSEQKAQYASQQPPQAQSQARGAQPLSQGGSHPPTESVQHPGFTQAMHDPTKQPVPDQTRSAQEQVSHTTFDATPATWNTSAQMSAPAQSSKAAENAATKPVGNSIGNGTAPTGYRAPIQSNFYGMQQGFPTDQMQQQQQHQLQQQYAWNS